MSKVDKEQYIEEILDMIESQLHYCIRDLQNFSEEKLNAAPKQGGWNTAQYIFHLVTYGRYYLPLVEKKIMQVKSGHEVWHRKGIMGAYFVKLMQKPTRYKAPPRHSPTATHFTHALVYEFIDQLETWTKLVRQSGSKEISGVRITTTISSLVKLKLLDLAAFIAYHNQRHLNQIRELHSGEAWQA